MPTIASHLAVAATASSPLLDGMTIIPHILILGGTGEARQLAQRLAATNRLRITLSLAGRTEQPLPQAGEVRRGGFGGTEGLADWLAANAVDMMVDATHPFARHISGNAEAAARATGVPLVRLERPPWLPVEGDRWIDAADVAQAAALLGTEPKTVFLAIGRQELAPFRTFARHRYIVRSVDPVAAEHRLPGARYILDRGPFAEGDERALLTAHNVEILVAKNSGGAATYAKIAAARALALPVVMVRRPHEKPADAATVDEAVAKILHWAGLPQERGE